MKCGQLAPYDGEPPLECPKCGAIYARVEAALAASRAAAEQSNQPQAISDVDDFADKMRAQSLYPAWRKIVGLFTVLGYVVAGLVLIGAFVTSKWSMGAMIAGVGGAALIALFVKVSKELSLMLADLSDAAVRMAASKEKGD